MRQWWFKFLAGLVLLVPAMVAAQFPPNPANGHILWSATAPAIASGFGSSPSVVVSNGTMAFQINVGTGGSTSSGVVTMPTAFTGWACQVRPDAAPQAAAIMYSAPTSASSITITNYTLTTGAALNWTSATVIDVTCTGY
jgi:hypothetical protein